MRLSIATVLLAAYVLGLILRGVSTGPAWGIMALLLAGLALSVPGEFSVGTPDAWVLGVRRFLTLTVAALLGVYLGCRGDDEPRDP